MTGRPGELGIGDRVRSGGRDQVVIGVSGPVVRLAGTGGEVVTVSVSGLLADGDFAVLDSRPRPRMPQVSVPDGLPAQAVEEARWWERHIVEVLTGVPPDTGEGMIPRPEYDPAAVTLTRREQAKAAELTAAGHPVTASAVAKRRRRYQEQGLSGMVDYRARRRMPPHGRADAAVVAAMRQAIGEAAGDSTRTAAFVFRRTREILAGAGSEAGKLPSERTLYRLFGRLEAGCHTTGSASTRRSLAARPEGPFGQVPAAAPGDVMQIDSTPLDVLVRLDNGVPDRVDLTGIIDVATRTVTAAVLRPTTKSVDASVLLARTVTPEPMRPGWPEAMRMAASALPFRRMLSIDERLEHAAARPVIIPQVIVVDHGKVFVSESFKASCAFLGISFQPARKATGTDKPHIERMLGSVATMFAQYVSGYTGRSPEYRGRGVEKNAVWSLPELQDLLDQWLIAEWQNRPHDGLRDPLHPGRAFSPNQKYAALIETAGYVPLALSPDDYIELLPATWRTVNAYGIKISRRVYDGKELNPLRMQHSGVTARKGAARGSLRPLRHLPGLGPRPLERRLDHRVLDPAAPGRGPVRGTGLGPRPQADARRYRGRARRRGPGPAHQGRPGTRRQERAGAVREAGPAGRRPHQGRPPGHARRPGARAGRGTGSRRARQPGGHRPDADLRPVPRGGEMAVTPPAAGSADPATQLTTLPGWRQFVAAVPSIPHLLPEQDWLSLEDGKRAAHDEERLEHHSRLVVVQTPVIGRIVRQGGNLIRMNRLARYGRSGLMVSGPARTGKTTAVTQLGKTAELMHRQWNPGSRDDIPVIYITVPPAATGKMIATEIARFLGLPVPRRANITDVIESVCGICLDTRVTMIIVDELHNLDMTTRAGAEASDTLKYFSERLPATFVYSGIGLDRGATLAGPRGDQVAGRFTLIPASAFTPGQEWSALIAAIEGSLRLYHHEDGSLVTLADYLHRAPAA